MLLHDRVMYEACNTSSTTRYSHEILLSVSLGKQSTRITSVKDMLSLRRIPYNLSTSDLVSRDPLSSFEMTCNDRAAAVERSLTAGVNNAVKFQIIVDIRCTFYPTQHDHVVVAGLLKPLKQLLKAFQRCSNTTNDVSCNIIM